VCVCVCVCGLLLADWKPRQSCLLRSYHIMEFERGKGKGVWVWVWVWVWALGTRHV
jgi:hypothetical protein